jgi:hypothetical protein
LLEARACEGMQQALPIASALPIEHASVLSQANT